MLDRICIQINENIKTDAWVVIMFSCVLLCDDSHVFVGAGVRAHDEELSTLHNMLGICVCFQLMRLHER